MTALTAPLWLLLAVMCLILAVLFALPVVWLLEDRPRGGRGMPIPLGELPPAFPGWLPRTLPPEVWADRNAGRFDSALDTGARDHPLSGGAPVSTLALDPVGAEIDSWGYDEPAWDYWRELHAVDPVL